MSSRTKHLVISWLLLVVLAAIWGSSFILMKRAMFAEDGTALLSNTHVAALRIVIASAAMLPFILRNFWQDLRQYVVPLAVAGWMGNGFPAFLFTAAQTQLDSSITGILNALTPLFTLIIAVALYRKRYPLINYIGIFVALVGAIMLIFQHSSSISGAPFRAYLLVAAATVCYAVSANVIRNHLFDLGAVKVTGLAMVLVSPVCLAILWFDGFFELPIASEQVWTGIPYVIILAVVGTAIALVLFNHLIKISNALFASSVTYLIPVVAVVWGFIDHETITWTDILFALIIISGVYMVNRKSTKPLPVADKT